MDIFESLENLPVSEACFNDVINLVEEYINELKEETVDKAREERTRRHEEKMEELENKKKNPSSPDDVDTMVNNRDIEGEKAEEEENYQKKMDLYQRWEDMNNERKKRKEQEEKEKEDK